VKTQFDGFTVRGDKAAILSKGGTLVGCVGNLVQRAEIAVLGKLTAIRGSDAMGAMQTRGEETHISKRQVMLPRISYKSLIAKNDTPRVI
jgi:hypothetical protein